MTIHLKFGGSTAARTLNCPGWHAQAEALPPGKASEYADEGTALHWAMAQILDDPDESPDTLLGRRDPETNIEITPALVSNKIEPALDAWNDLCDRYNIDEYEVETMVRFNDEIGGTLDFAGRGADADGTPVALLLDFKFGDGVMVFPESSAQLNHYAMDAWRTDGVKDLFDGVDKHVFAIIQPNTRGEDTLRVWETDVHTIKNFEGRYLQAVNLSEYAVAGSADHLNAGDWCTFCPALAVCPVKTGLAARLQRLDPSKLEQIGEFLDVAKELEEMIAAGRKLAHEQMERGDKIPGWKLVHKRAYRSWTDADLVEDVCKRSRKLRHEETHDYRLLSPAQMETLCKRKGLDFKKFEEHIAKVSSGTTIAPEDDPRPEAPAVAALKALAQAVG